MPITSEPEQHIGDESSRKCEEDAADSDYVMSSEQDSDHSSNESANEELENEKKYIVFKSMIDQLFQTCKTCGSHCEIDEVTRGSMLIITATCLNNHIFSWRSQPELHGKPAGEILIPAATVITGGTYEPMKQFADGLNLKFVSKCQCTGEVCTAC